MYKCKYFKLKELVPPKIFDKYGERAWGFLDDRALITIDALRKKFGKITINDYSWGGPNKYRGFRPYNSNVGAIYSQHKFGRAFDCVFVSITAEEVRVYIKENPEEFPYVNSMEEDVTWLHFDCRNCNRILTYKP
jgi:hypothetical protein